MAVPALADDLNTEVAAQLALVGEDFEIVRSLAVAGAITTTELRLDDPNLPFDQYEAIGRWIGIFNRACSWWVGDWLIFGEGIYGERMAQAALATGLAEQTLLNRAWVSKNVPPSRRRAGLAFSVHAEIAALPAGEQKRWLDKAEKGGWTRAELRSHMKATRKDEKPPLIGDEADPAQVIEAATALLAHAREEGAEFICRAEDVARLRSALGQE